MDADIASLSAAPKQRLFLAVAPLGLSGALLLLPPFTKKQRGRHRANSVRHGDGTRSLQMETAQSENAAGRGRAHALSSVKTLTASSDPAAGSTLHGIARAALAYYNLGPNPAVRPIRLLNNAVFEVAGAQGRFVLRIHRPGYRSIEHIRSELSVLEVLAYELHGSSISVPRPVLARDGRLMVTIEEPSPRRPQLALHCDLLTWIDGRVLKQGKGLGSRSAFLLGEGLARLHVATQSLARNLELPRWDGETMFSERSPFEPGPMEDFLSPEALDIFQNVADRARCIFKELGRGQEEWGIIHNDYILINCHFERRANRWKLGVLDFDDVGWGYFLYDLAPLLGNLFDWPDAFRRLRRAFLDGYRSVRSLPVEVERHLPVLMAARHAASLTWLAAKQRRADTDVAVARHVAVRVAEMKRCLALA